MPSRHPAASVLAKDPCARCSRAGISCRLRPGRRVCDRCALRRRPCVSARASVHTQRRFRDCVERVRSELTSLLSLLDSIDLPLSGSPEPVTIPVASSRGSVSPVSNTVEPYLVNNPVLPLDNVDLSTFAADSVMNNPSDVSTTSAPLTLASDSSMVGAGAAGILASDNFSFVNSLNSTLPSVGEWDAWFTSSS
jgi:hypothetical protein